MRGTGGERGRGEEGGMEKELGEGDGGERGRGEEGGMEKELGEGEGGMGGDRWGRLKDCLCACLF